MGVYNAVKSVDWVLLEGITYKVGYLIRFCIEKNKKREILYVKVPLFFY
jgi:hypothetical protein